MPPKQKKKLSISLLTATMLAVFVICSIPCTAQTIDDTCICGERNIKAVEMLAVDARAYKAAYEQERKTRLADSVSYNSVIVQLNKSILEKEEALKLEQALPKVIIKANPDWYWFAAGGSAVTAIIYFVFKLFILK